MIDPEDHSHLLVGISCAGVFESRDAGESWEVRNNGLRADFLPDPDANVGHDPHLLVACPAKPEYLWQQNHCGMFKSSGSQGSWLEVSDPDGPAGFGFAITVDERNPDMAWGAPAVSDAIPVAVDHGLCICRTEDGGKSWRPLREGLPREPCFDIVYRHGFAKNENAIVFGTTTGHLFYSPDPGEHWEVISNYLPMIYAVSIVEA